MERGIELGPDFFLTLARVSSSCKDGNQFKIFRDEISSKYFERFLKIRNITSGRNIYGFEAKLKTL